MKPLSRYLTSYMFWRDYLGDNANVTTRNCDDHVCKAALGYLRTYFYIAQDPGLHLIPAGITWKQFCNFTTDLVKISDRDVCERYAYGEIGLRRLNFYAPLLLGKSHFQRMDYQYREHFAYFYAPILFVIGITSILLGGLQVAVAVTVSGPDPVRNGPMLLVVAFWFSVMTMICFCSILVLLFSLFVYKVVKEWRYAI